MASLGDIITKRITTASLVALSNNNRLIKVFF